jgi:AraC-like DNA-binding protein
LIILQELIAVQIRQSRKPTIELAAEVTGVTKRTLQRYLGSKATTYTKLVDQVRFKMAMPLLRDDSLSISGITQDLGYSNIAHFSRAFSRMTGLSPHAYRGLLKR